MITDLIVSLSDVTVASYVLLGKSIAILVVPFAFVVLVYLTPFIVMLTVLFANGLQQIFLVRGSILLYPEQR